MRVAILDDYSEVVRGLDCFGRLGEAGHDATVLTERVPDPQELAGRLGDVEALVLIRERTPVTARLLDALPTLRLVAQTGSGVAHVDLAACAERRVTVCAGGGSPVSTAELTFGLILASVRRIPAEAAKLREGRWRQVPGTELHGKTLGIAGYGGIGSLVASFGRAFGMRVVAWGREGSLARAAADGVETAASLRALLAEADVASLHLKLTPQTRGLVTAEDLATMKPASLLVNTARAGLIAPGALAAALAASRPGAAAVDVFEEEPADPAREPLLALDNALCTPHLGYVTHESLELYLCRAFDAVHAFAAGVPVDVVGAAA